MNRKEWLERELEKEREKEERLLKEKAAKEAQNLEKILNDAKIDKKDVENIVGFFKLLRVCHAVDDSAYVSLAVAMEVFPLWKSGLDKETQDLLDPKKIYKLL